MKSLVLVYLFLMLYFAACAQENSRKSYHGGVFTPKGDFKALIVPVIFKDYPQTNPAFANSDQAIDAWSAGNISNLPDYIDPVTGIFPK